MYLIRFSSQSVGHLSRLAMRLTLSYTNVKSYVNHRISLEFSSSVVVSLVSSRSVVGKYLLLPFSWSKNTIPCLQVGQSLFNLHQFARHSKQNVCWQGGKDLSTWGETRHSALAVIEFASRRFSALVHRFHNTFFVRFRILSLFVDLMRIHGWNYLFVMVIKKIILAKQKYFVIDVCLINVIWPAL